MTIKKRLFWSNVLMILIPVLLSLLLTAIAINLVLDRMGMATTSHADSNLFNKVVKMAQRSENKWDKDADAQQILNQMHKWGVPSKSGAVTLAIYEGDMRLDTLGNFSDTELMDIAIAHPDGRHFTIDTSTLFFMKAGPYRIYLQNMNHEYEEMGSNNGTDNGPLIGIGLIILVIILILATNRLLTHLVFKSIVTPLDVLVNGVHEIQDGNLNYRIAYTKNDEFLEVCEDFNEMAHRIQELMTAKQRDDENRRELIAGISHDLRTPLTSIIAYVEGLTKGIIKEPVMQQEYLNTIASKSKDLEHIVEQLFQFAKLDVGDFPFSLQQLNIGAELQKYVESEKNEYERRGLYITMGRLADAIVSVDAVQIRNVFTNLLENSLKYGSQKDGQVHIQCIVIENQVEIYFTDNGAGVPEEKLDKLFNAFYRADKARSNPGQGSGLGLAISHRIIRGLGGAIRAKNVTGGGLQMIITLPVTTGGNLYEKNSNN